MYFEHDPPIEELCDLQMDPREQTNVASDDEYSAILSALRKKTAELQAHAIEPTNQSGTQ